MMNIGVTPTPIVMIPVIKVNTPRLSSGLAVKETQKLHLVKSRDTKKVPRAKKLEWCNVETTSQSSANLRPIFDYYRITVLDRP